MMCIFTSYDVKNYNNHCKYLQYIVINTAYHFPPKDNLKLIKNFFIISAILGISLKPL